MALFLMVMCRLVKRRGKREPAVGVLQVKCPKRRWRAVLRRALRSKTPLQTAGIKTAVFASLRKVLLFYLREQLTFAAAKAWQN